MTEPKRTKKGTFAKGSSGNPTGVARSYGDGWGSLWTGIGNSTHDKRTSHNFIPPCLSYQQLIDLSETDDIGERAVKMPVDDAMRKGYEISITDEGEFDDLKNDILKQLRRLKFNQKIKKALYQKRGLGGSAIFLGVEDFRPLSAPINQNALRGIKFLTVLEPQMLQPFEYYDDPSEDNYGEVKLWQVTATINGSGSSPDAVKLATNKRQANSYLVHESRLIVLKNEKISEYSNTRNPAGDEWGPSILLKLYEVLRDFHISWAAAGLIVTDFSQGVFSIENLMQLVMRDEEKLIERMRALDTGRSVARSIVVDKEHESFERKSTNVAGLPDMLVQLSTRLAMAIDIPLRLLMSSGAKSEDAEVGDELRYYYDKCETIRTDEIEPVLRFVIECIIRGLRERKIPKQWSIKWHPLWQLTEEQQANARLAQARVDMIYIQAGVLDPQTVAMVRFGGEYSYETPLPPNYEAPGFMALPPVGVLVDGLDPKTGLPPGVQPPPAEGGGGGGTAAVGVKPHARNKPRRVNAAKTPDRTAGGATAGRGQAQRDEAHCTTPHKLHEIQECEHCAECDECLMAKAGKP